MASPRRLATPTLAVTSLVLLAVACSDTTGLPKASLENTVDTVSLFALSDPVVQQPSAYLLQGKLRVRTDQSTLLDFAFDFDSLGRPALYPTGAIHLGTASGLRPATTVFDSIKIAPTGGYELDKALTLDTGTVLLVRSRLITCLNNIRVPLYAKLRVLGVDTTAQRLDFEILVDQNCGYRGLAPGLPTQ